MSRLGIDGKIKYTMIYLGADHRGFNLKERVKEWLNEWGVEFRDLGAEKYEKEDDYPVIAFRVAETVASERTKGILICGSGIGAEVAANKVEGIRAGLGYSEKQIRAARNDDDINVICLNADEVDEETNKLLVSTFLNTLFGSEERYIRRIKEIKDYETKKRN